MLRVENLRSRKGLAIVNQFVITDAEKVTFQSYESVIAVYDNNILTLGKNWNYSITTRKHLYHFIREYTNCDINSNKDVLKAIKENSIILDKGLS